jgi:hypothetical protein
VTRPKWKIDFVHLEIVLILTQGSSSVCAEQTIGSKNHFRHTGWNFLVTWVMRNLVLIYSKTVLASVQDRCSVCVKHTIGLEIILDTPNGAPR